MPNNCLSVLYKRIIQVENKNVGLKVVGGGHKHTIAPPPPIKKVGGHMPPLPPPPPPPPPASYASVYTYIHTYILGAIGPVGSRITYQLLKLQCLSTWILVACESQAQIFKSRFQIPHVQLEMKS